jgi:hypothetical protein
LETFQLIGIDIPLFFGFIVANLFSWLWADKIIQKLYSKRFEEITHSNKDQTVRKAEAMTELWRSTLDIDFGKRIGRIERIFYIYSFTLGQLSLLSAWVILKAFYGWIQKPDIARSETSENDKAITTFYTYIYGNALSILAGLILSHFGLVLAKLAEVIFL